MFERPVLDPSSPVRFTEATRVVGGVLAPLERRTLLWLAARMPPWINSDHLTVLALAAMVGAGASYYLARIRPLGLVLASVCLAINWFGDSLDGTLARVRRHERPRYGYYVDHIVDALGVLALLGGLALSGYMTPWVAGGLLVAYYLLSIEVYLAAHTLGQFRISYFKVGPTELRILLAAGNTTLLFNPTVTVFGVERGLFDVGGVIAVAAMFATAAINAVTNTRTLYRAEPLARVTGGKSRS